MIDTPTTRDRPTWPRLMRGHAPALLIVGALALLVVVVPSKSRTETTATLDELAGGPTAPGARVEAGPGRGAAQGEASGLTGGTSTIGSAAVRNTQGNGARAGSPGGAGGAGASAGVGTASSEADCSRNAILDPTGRSGFPCKPAWSDDNGGSTYRNVTATETAIMAYLIQIKSLEPALAANGWASQEDVHRTLAVWEKWLNANFQTYGRRVRVVGKFSECSDAPCQTADAQKAIKEENIFASVTVANAPFINEFAAQGHPSLAGPGIQVGESWYAERFPYVFGWWPDSDLINAHVAEYTCKRLNGRNAVHAGDPVYTTRERAFGIFFLDADPFSYGGHDLRRRLEACGVTVPDNAFIGYPPEVTTAAQNANNLVAQMKAAGVTSVLCACDSVAPTILTTGADNQAYFPEWIAMSYMATDKNLVARLYSQNQWSHAFGVSPSPVVYGFAETAGWKAYKAVDPEGKPARYDDPRAALFDQLVWMFRAIEAAGPTLNPRTYASGLLSLNLRPAGPSDTAISFGRNGPGPYTVPDSFMEVWWASTRTGADGKAGTYVYVDGGKHHDLGQWPAGDPNVFVDDGSRQPGRDPNL